MKPNQSILIIHAEDSGQHLGKLTNIVNRLEDEDRIESYSLVLNSGLDNTDLSTLGAKDMAIVLATSSLSEQLATIENILLNQWNIKPGLQLVTILVDKVSYSNKFKILPDNKRPIREQMDMDAAWQNIEMYFFKKFPAPKIPVDQNFNWKKFWPHATAVLGLIILFIVLFRPKPPKNVTLENFTEKFGFDKKAEDWLGAFSSTKRKLVKFYQNHETENAQKFTEFAVETLVKDKDTLRIDMEEIYIETETTDLGTQDTGVLQFFPKPQLIKNPIVEIEFGTTHSDTLSADQEVAQELIEGIVYAVKMANNNLSTRDKIKSIYVMATTNGKHGPNSNHYSGAAVDISRINNVKMVLMDEVQLKAVNQMQKAFNSFSYVRENFGPTLKNKFFVESNKWDYDYKVGGHVDHIHFSVRKPSLISMHDEL